MSYKINEKYQEFPRYRGIREIIRLGMIFGVIKRFESVKECSFFVTNKGEIYQKLERSNLFRIHGRVNAETHDTYGKHYNKFNGDTLVEELNFIPATPETPSYSYEAYEFSLKRLFRCYKTDKLFLELPVNAMFTAQKVSGFWKKIPVFMTRGYKRNAMTVDHKGVHYHWFKFDDEVKHATEKKPMTKEEYTSGKLTEEEMAKFTEDEVQVKVKPQISETITVGIVQITCKAFQIMLTLNEEDERVKCCSAEFKIGNKMVRFSEKDKIVVSYKGEKLTIIPVKIISNIHNETIGFILKIKGGDGTWSTAPLTIGDSIVVTITRAVQD